MFLQPGFSSGYLFSNGQCRVQQILYPIVQHPLACAADGELVEEIIQTITVIKASRTRYGNGSWHRCESSVPVMYRAMEQVFTHHRRLLDAERIMGIPEHKSTFYCHRCEAHTMAPFRSGENGKRSVERNFRLCMNCVGSSPNLRNLDLKRCLQHLSIADNRAGRTGEPASFRAVDKRAMKEAVSEMKKSPQACVDDTRTIPRAYSVRPI